MLNMEPLPVAFSQMYAPTQQDINRYWANKTYDITILIMLNMYLMPYYIVAYGMKPVASV